MLVLTITATIFKIVYSFNCLETIIKNEFEQERDVEIIAENYDFYTPLDVPLTVSQFRNSEIRNTIWSTDDPKFLPQLNPTGKYLIVTQNLSAIPEFLRLAQNQKVFRLLVLHGQDIYYTKNPHFCGKTSMVAKRSDCNYPKNIYQVRTGFTHRCRLKIGYVTSPPFVTNIWQNPNPGVMVSLVTLVGKLARLGLDYQNSSRFDHELLSNGTLHQLGRALEQGQIDVAIGRLMMNETMADFGPLIFKDMLLFSAPKPKKLKSYRKLFNVFKMEIWVRIFGGLGVMVLLFYFFGLCEDFKKTTFFGVAFDVVRIGLGGGVGRLPKWVSFRILLVFFSLFSLSMDSVYLGNLSQIFAFTSYDVNVDNLEMIRVVRMKFVISWEVERLLILKYVLRGNPRADKQLFVRDLSQSYLLHNTALAKENGTILFQSLLESHPSELFLLDHFHVITDYISLFVTLYLRRDAYFGEAFKFWAQEIVEKGLVGKWLDDIKRSNIKIGILPEEEEKMVVLKVAHFEESFRVLLGGYVLAIVVLPLEFLYLQLEKMGVVQKVKENIVFLVLLLKPPSKTKKSVD